MKKKVVKLNKLSLTKETISSLSIDKVIGGISQVASCICTAIQEQNTCGIPCSRVTCDRQPTQCQPCQSGGCSLAIGC